MYEIIPYESKSGRCPIKEYMTKLTKQNKTKEIAQIKEYIRRLEEHGMAVNNTFPETIRKLRDDVYELRPGTNRVFFFYWTGKTFVLLHGYKKQSQEAPPREIEKAVNEMEDFKRRENNG